MKPSFAVAGNKGPKIRSDCEISVNIVDGGGIHIDLVSRVKTLYGDSINKLVADMLIYFGVDHAEVVINDSGALPYVIMARLESVIKQLIETDLDYLPDFNGANTYTTSRDRFRITRLYIPGDSPGLMINAGLHKADGIILDLEDSVAQEKKDEARILVRNALRQVDFYGAERMVRINQGERGMEDLRYVIPHNVNLILIPKCESAHYIKKIVDEIADIKTRNGLTSSVYLMPIIESAAGLEKSFEIASASDDIVAMAIGLEDFTADLGVVRTSEGKESLYARSRMVVAARAAGIQAIDSVYSDIGDMEGLRINVRESKSLGFEGMGCIHPRQIPVVRQGFAPDEAEIVKSREIVMAFETARHNGLGVVSLGSKMIDPPVVARAQKTIDLAVRMGSIPVNWAGNKQVDMK